jgi:hypothetical protein
MYGYVELIRMPPPDQMGMSIAIEVGMVGVIKSYTKPNLIAVRFGVGEIWLNEESVRRLTPDDVLAKMKSGRFRVTKPIVDKAIEAVFNDSELDFLACAERGWNRDDNTDVAVVSCGNSVIDVRKLVTVVLKSVEGRNMTPLWIVMTICLYGGFTSETLGKIIVTIEHGCKVTGPQVSSMPFDSELECEGAAAAILWARRPGDPVIDIWCQEKGGDEHEER